MSLRVDDHRSRGRSKSRERSRTRDDRSRSRDARAPSPPRINTSSEKSRGSTYEYASPTYTYASPTTPSGHNASISSQSGYSQSGAPQYQDRGRQSIPGSQPGYAVPGQYEHADVRAPYADTSKYMSNQGPPNGPSGSYTRSAEYPPTQVDRPQYAQPKQYAYADPETRERGY